MTHEHPGLGPHPSKWRAILQVTGFVIGLALLAWCVMQVFSPANQQALRTLRDAPPQRVLLLIAINVLVVLSAGLSFYFALRPVRRINFLDLQATNAIAIFLGYAPFKIGMIFRVVVHHRRDRLPIALIAAWFAAISLAMAAALLPLIVASVTGHGINDRWVEVAAGGILLTSAALWLSARTFSGPRGMDRIRALAGATRIAALSRFAESRVVHNLHEGFDMLDRPGRVATLVFLRLVDLGIQATRFFVAARLLGVEMTWESAVLIASTHFIIGVISPSGMVGTREAGAAGVASILHIANMSQAATVGVLILATESVVNLTLALLGLARLGATKMFVPRPDR
jgi:hypothetical protein